MRTAQAFMRHSDPRLTTQTYTDKRFVDLRVALKALPVIPVDFGSNASALLQATRTDGETAQRDAKAGACKAECQAEKLSSGTGGVASDGVDHASRATGSGSEGDAVNSCPCGALASIGNEKGTAVRGAFRDTPKGIRTPVSRMRT